MRSARRWTWAAATLALAALAAFLWLRSRGEPGPAGAPERGAGTASPVDARPGLEGHPATPTPAAVPPPAETAPAATPLGPWRVEGRVLDGAGKPVVGATVEALLAWGGERRSIPSGRSGPEGAYALDLATARAMGPISVQGATLRWFAWANGHAPSEQADHDAWPKAASFETHVVHQDLALRAGNVLYGRVVRSDGTPVAGAEVVPCSGAGVRAEPGSTLPDGRYVIARPPGGGWRLIAFSQEDGAGRAPIDPSPEAREAPDVVLGPTPSVEGHVVYADGAPVADVVLAAEFVEGPDHEAPDPCLGDWGQGRTRSGADGRFRVLLPRGGPCRVWLPDADVEARCRTGDRTVRLVVTSRRVRVRVVGAQGVTLEGLSYSSISWGAENAGRLDDLIEGRIDLDRARLEADVFEAGSDSGRVRDFFGPAGSAWLYVVHADGVQPLEAALRAPAAGNETDVRLELKPPSSAGALRLKALDPNGTTLSLLHVSASTPLGSRLWSGVLPEDGVVPGLSAGTVRLDLRPIRDRTDEGWVPPPGSWLLPTTARVTVAAGPPTEATVRVPWGGRVRLVLRSPPGTEPDASEKYALHLVPTAGGNTVHPMTYPEDPTGKAPNRISSHFASDRPVITAEAMPAGDYRLEVAGRGRGWTDPVASGPIRVIAHETVDLVLDLKRE